MPDSPTIALENPELREAIARGFIEIRDNRITYHLNQKREYDWTDPEEWVRARSVAFLIVAKNYPANRMRVEVQVPRRTPTDYADIVVYRDDRCADPYLIVENKSAGQSTRGRAQGIEQLFGNANSLRAPLGLYDEWDEHMLFDVGNFPATERAANRKGNRAAVPSLYGGTPSYTFIAGGETDIAPVPSGTLETKIRRSHSIIWSGGKRDPLTAFDEWSKLLFAKVVDERRTPSGDPRSFQVGSNETITAVANRVHRLFARGCQDDPTIFAPGTRIGLPDRKIFDVVDTLQPVSLMGTDVDAVGSAFENFYGSIFRGELGQYFTMRQLARFGVSMLEIDHESFVIDPTAGSGGFLLESLLQVWHAIDNRFRGQSKEQIERIKTDFALLRVYGIEIHDVLSRICKINLLLHHDGHTNIEGDRSCLDSTFVNPRLQAWSGRFSRVVGNPPFGDDVEENDEDKLGSNKLESFVVAKGRDSVPSEHVIVERSVDLLEAGGRFGLVIPDGVLNNQGELSNCPRVRAFLAKSGHVEAIVSLPDFAFRKSGAQNKTSMLFFRKFTREEAAQFTRRFDDELELLSREDRANGSNRSESDLEEIAIGCVYAQLPFSALHVFLAEPNHIGYMPTGIATDANDLYRGASGGRIDADQSGTVLGEWRAFRTDPSSYKGRQAPDCISRPFHEVWNAHQSHRLDPKYHIFKNNEHAHTPDGWLRVRISRAMRKREEVVDFSADPETTYKVMTISQTGDIRDREAGKGRNPPAWQGMYLDNGASSWFAARMGDVVYSSIDLWKGCIAVVPEAFDGALVTKEFPIYEIVDERLDAEFLSFLLRTRYYQRAFRAITTGHSNRRRTQQNDFESLEICFPPTIAEQKQIIANLRTAKATQKAAAGQIKAANLAFSDVIDGRRDEELPEVEATVEDDAPA